MNKIKIFLSVIIVFLTFFTSCKETKSNKEEAEKSKTVQNKIVVPTAMSDHWKFIGEAVNEPGYDVWGSSPIRDEKGNVHIFSA